MSGLNTSSFDDNGNPRSRLHIIHWCEAFDNIPKYNRLPSDLDNLIVLTEIHTTLYTMAEYEEPLVCHHPKTQELLAEINDGRLTKKSDSPEVVEWFDLCENVGMNDLKPIMLDLEDNILNKCKALSGQSRSEETSMMLDYSMQSPDGRLYENTVRDVELFNSTQLLPADFTVEHSESDGLEAQAN